MSNVFKIQYTPEGAANKKTQSIFVTAIFFEVYKKEEFVNSAAFLNLTPNVSTYEKGRIEPILCSSIVVDGVRVV